MKSSFFHSLPLVGCLAFVSCFPIQPDRRGARDARPDADPNASITSADQQKIDEQRELMKQRAKENEELAEKEKEKEAERETPPDKPIKRPDDFAFANPVPGKEGFVFSPFNNKLVDVRDIPSGTLVRDPTFPEAEKKFFRVP